MRACVYVVGRECSFDGREVFVHVYVQNVAMCMIASAHGKSASGLR